MAEGSEPYCDWAYLLLPRWAGLTITATTWSLWAAPLCFSFADAPVATLLGILCARWHVLWPVPLLENDRYYEVAGGELISEWCNRSEDKIMASYYEGHLVGLFTARLPTVYTILSNRNMTSDITTCNGVLHAHSALRLYWNSKLGGVKTKYPLPSSRDISPVKVSMQAACVTIAIPHGVLQKPN
jgi:hypothetical protein